MTMDRRRFLSSSASVLAAMQTVPAQTATPGTDGATISDVSSSARGWAGPRPMFWSFDNKDPRVSMAGYLFSFQVFTVGKEENTYSLNASSLRQKQEGDRWLLTASQLSWPGQQMAMPGTLEAEAVIAGDSVILRVRASATDPVRAIKVRIHGLPVGLVAE